MLIYKNPLKGAIFIMKFEEILVEAMVLVPEADIVEFMQRKSGKFLFRPVKKKYLTPHFLFGIIAKVHVKSA